MSRVIKIGGEPIANMKDDGSLEAAGLENINDFTEVDYKLLCSIGNDEDEPDSLEDYGMGSLEYQEELQKDAKKTLAIIRVVLWSSLALALLTALAVYWYLIR